MKSLRGAFALGLLPTTAVAQSVVTVRLPTCIPGGGTGILGGGTPGIPVPGPAPTGLRTEIIDVTATISPGSITVEQVTQVITPGASATIEPSSFVAELTTTNSLGSTVVETTSGITTAPVQSTIPVTFTTAFTTTNSIGSSVVETSTGTSPATGPLEPETSVGPTSPVASTTPGVPTTPAVGPTGPVESSPVESTPVGPPTVGPPSVGPSSVVPTTPVPPGTTTPPVVTPSTTPTAITPTTAAPPPPVVTPTSAAPAPTVTQPNAAPPSGPYTGPSCPASNNTNYETVFYNTYNITCGLDLVGTNADSNTHADNELDCLYSCDLLVGCVGASWTGTADANVTNCYPYYSVTNTQSDGAGSELFAGVNINGPNNGTDTPDDYCDPAGANQTVITDLFGKSYFVGCGQQINSPGLLEEVTTTNMEACIEYCSICYSCVAVGYTGIHTAGFANTPNCFTFSENGVISQNLTVNYALVQS